MTTLSSLSKHPVAVATPADTICAAANLMRKHHVGALVVVADASAPGKPLGIVTDRDIVVAIVALGLDPGLFLVDDMIDRPLTVARADQLLRDGLEIMRAKGIRRLPLVDAAGVLAGIVTLDDVIRELTKDMHRIADLVDREIDSELQLRPGSIRARKRKSPRAVDA